MSADLSSPGRKIRFFREARDLTQKALGEKVNACQASVSIWERDMRLPPKIARQELCKLFALPDEYLFAPAEPKPTEATAA